jgi:hypothetical protein
MTDFDSKELVGLYESIHDNEEKASGLKEQIKMVGADSTEKFKTFAEANEVEISDLKEGYKHYKRVHDNGESDDDLYTIMAKVDEALANETAESEKK